MIEFNCEKCGSFYKVKDSYSGKTVRCKKCKHTMKVPASPEFSLNCLPDTDIQAGETVLNYNSFFAALAREERTAPPLASC